MTGTPTPDSGLAELRRLVDVADKSVYDAVAGTPTPHLDRVMVNLSNAANHSRLWLATAGALALLGGDRGRRAACQGVMAVALASAVTNLVLKPVARRRRPAGSGDPVPHSRQVRRPVSRSFPSGHAASAFAFATSTGQVTPGVWLPLHAAAATVAFSRVHTGVHYASDVVIGAMVGDLCGHLTGWLATGSPQHRATGRWR